MRRLACGLLGATLLLAPAVSAQDVPFVPQDDLLCGPASLAMVYRAWGARDVHPAAWRHLVRPDEGGVRAGDLAAAAAAGPPGAGVPWRARAAPLPDLAALAGTAARGPVIVLLEDRPGTYHYVVVLAAEDGRVRFHDPATGPRRSLPADAFDDAWRKSGRWSLAVLPPAEGAATELPAPPAPPETPEVLAASRHFRAGRWLEAADAAGPDAPRLKAAALWLGGRPHEALAEWNALGEARLDLVRVDGLHRVRHRVVHDHLGLRSGRPLPPGDLARARRRLEALPAVGAARLDYRPVEGGALVEVRAAVVERASPVRERAALLATAARALLDGRVRAGVGATGAGEWFEVDIRPTGARRETAVRVAAPGVAGLPGVVTVEGARVWETHPGAEHTLERASVRAEDWATGALRWSAGAALERWDGGRPRPAVEAGLGLRDASDRLDVAVRGRLAGGPSGRWAGGSVRGSVRSAGPEPSSGGTAWRVEAGWEAVTGHAPLPAWPGAGTGRMRDALLRAHPLESDGVVAGPAFARGLAGATAEVVRWLAPLGPLRVGVALFVDAAHASGGRASGVPPDAPGRFLDTGAGLRLDVPGLPGALRADAATGLLDRSRAVSFGWSPPWPGVR